jgi:leucyl aminopeptidase
MNTQILFSPASDISSPVLLLPLWLSSELPGHAQVLDEKLGGLLKSVVEEDGFKASVGATRVVHAPQHSTPRVILLGLGAREKFSAVKWTQAVARGARGVRAIKKTQAALILPECDVAPGALAQGAVEGALLGLHMYNDFKTDAESKALAPLESLSLIAPDESQREELEAGIARGTVAAQANIAARGWVNAPSNTKSPQFLALTAERIARENNLKCEVWDDARIREEKMDALYAVGMGSDNPSRFIILEHAPAGHEGDAPIVLVGKGMTFDSGGYSLKPPTSMEDMKDDMAGAAVVLGVMEAVGKTQPAQRIIALIPSAENMVSGNAQRPGDIVRARSGLTIEVLNTDAEGRLILADALSYASEMQPAPRAVVDYATLTGAIRVALGTEGAGLFSNDDNLAAQLSTSGERTGDRVWRFPLWDEYKDYMKGTVSDLKNIGPERAAGSIAAAIFLEKFVASGIPWAHLDIAAVSLLREDKPLCARGATGFGVRLTLDWLQSLQD